MIYWFNEITVNDYFFLNLENTLSTRRFPGWYPTGGLRRDKVKKLYDRENKLGFKKM